jgi:hypothetical protein
MTLERPMFPPKAEPFPSSQTDRQRTLRAVPPVPVPPGWAPASPHMLPTANGAEFDQRVRDRIRLLAAERGLPESEIKTVMKLKDWEIVKFADRHAVSFDWLLCGCLKGLLRMAKRSRTASSWLATSKIDGGANA